MRRVLEMMLVAWALVLGACGMAPDKNRDYAVTVRRPPADVLAAIAAVASDVDADSVTPYLAEARLTTTNPDPNSVRVEIPGDSPDKMIIFTFAVAPKADGAATDLHVTTDIPDQFGPDDATHKAKDGANWADTMHHEVTAMVRSLDDGTDPAAAAFSFKMGLHILAQNNRRDLQDAFARVAGNPEAFGQEMGRKAGDRFVDTSSLTANMTDEQRARIKAQVHDMLDKYQAGKPLSSPNPGAPPVLPGDVMPTDR